MQPLQFILHSTGAWLCSSIITFALLGGPIAGNLELHGTVFFVVWLTGIVAYWCGRDSNR
jgi:hypothetical protein